MGCSMHALLLMYFHTWLSELQTEGLIIFFFFFFKNAKANVKEVFRNPVKAGESRSAWRRIYTQPRLDLTYPVIMTSVDKLRQLRLSSASQKQFVSASANLSNTSFKSVLGYLYHLSLLPFSLERGYCPTFVNLCRVWLNAYRLFLTGTD